MDLLLMVKKPETSRQKNYKFLKKKKDSGESNVIKMVIFYNFSHLNNNLTLQVFLNLKVFVQESRVTILRNRSGQYDTQ